jgi:alkaline phosphatase D
MNVPRIAFWIVIGLLLSICSPSRAESVVSRIGLAGCHRQDWPAPALFRYVEANPDLMIWLGDNVYADTKDDIGYIEKCYGLLSAHPAFEQLRKEVPLAAIWDDHDYGLDNVGRHYPLKEQSKQLFRRFWRLESLIPKDRDGIYHAQYFGDGETRLQVLLLDTRFNRDDEGENSDTLGENQWAWLEEELTKPARLRLIASGYQVLLDRESRFETWSKFPKAQKRLFNAIRDAKAEGVVFLAGDQHYGEASRMPKALGYDAIELMFAGINQEEPHVFNSYRVTPVANSKNSYALIDIQWQSTEADPPHFVFRCFDADRDSLELTYRVNFSELSLDANAEPTH